MHCLGNSCCRVSTQHGFRFFPFSIKAKVVFRFLKESRYYSRSLVKSRDRTQPFEKQGTLVCPVTWCSHSSFTPSAETRTLVNQKTRSVMFKPAIFIILRLNSPHIVVSIRMDSGSFHVVPSHVLDGRQSEGAAVSLVGMVAFQTQFEKPDPACMRRAVPL